MKTWRVDLPNFQWNGFPQGHGTLVVCDNGAVMACTDFGNYGYHFRQREFTPQQLLSFIHLKKPKTYNNYLLEKFCHFEKEYDGKSTVAWIRRVIKESGDTPQERKQQLDQLRDYNCLESEQDFNDWLEVQELSPDAWEMRSDKFTVQHVAFVTEFLPRALRLMIKQEVAA